MDGRPRFAREVQILSRRRKISARSARCGCKARDLGARRGRGEIRAEIAKAQNFGAKGSSIKFRAQKVLGARKGYRAQDTRFGAQA